jgi:hypothetical protein
VAEVRIAVGRFVLQLGAPEGTRADPGTTIERTSRDRLADAFRRPVSSLPAAAETADDLTSVADEVTGAVEKAESRINAIADGLTLDPKALSKQIDALLAVFVRADREGRFADEVSLARSLVTLLALVGRWAALLETLRRVARAAAALGERGWEAWAQHERGTLALAAEDHATASEFLNRALAQRNALGDEAGAALTLHNLQLLATIPPDEYETERGFVRRHAVALAIAAVLLLGLGAAAVGLALADGDEETTTTTPATTGEETVDTGGATEPEPDTEEPTIGFEIPEFSRGAQTLTAEADDDSGSVRVTFEVRPSAETSFAEIGSTDAAPFTAVWETSGLEDGPYVLRAVAADEAGNDADKEGTTTVDNNAPMLEFADDVSDRVVQGDTITVAGTVDDGAGSGISSVFVTIALEPGAAPTDGRPAEEVEPLVAEAEIEEQDGTDTFSVDIEMDVPTGAYEIEAVATDAVGNTREAVQSLGVFTVD